jgi:hypothetical protein
MSIHDLCLALNVQRGIRKLREDAGDPENLAAARKRLAAAIEAENTTRGALADIDVGDGTGPVLVRQIQTLQNKLSKLTEERIAAESAVGRLESMRSNLRDRAPRWLKESVEREIAAMQRSLPIWRRHQEICAELYQHEKLVEWFKYHGVRYRGTDPFYISYAKVWLSDSVRRLDDGSEAVDVDAIKRHVEKLTRTLLPALQSELATVRAEWGVQVAAVEAPLERWVQHGLHDS